MGELVLSDSRDRVCTLTLNRPDARNAMSSELQRDLAAALAAAEADEDVDVVVLTGADPAFCAGLDLRELGSTAANLVGGRDGEHRSPFTVLWTMTKPVIGAINGAAITGGFELALHCSFLVASERARFADTHSRVGIQPGWGLTALLTEAVGVRRARQLSVTGNFLDAPTALAWGLVNHVVPHDDLLAFCRQLAADIVSNDQAGVRRILATYAEQQRLDRGGALDLELAASRDWLRGGGGAAEAIEERRGRIMERGRAQAQR